MCTVTWLREPGAGYRLFANRDERFSRRPGIQPSVFQADGVRFLAPRDGERGGAWIAANEYGLSLCLLNRYGESVRSACSPEGRTRGEIVMAAASSRALEEVKRRMLLTDLSCFEPFTLLCIAPGRPALTLNWSGVALAGDFQAEERCPLISSSRSPNEAQRVRHALYERMRGKGFTPQTLLDFHASHEPDRGSLSPCMHRDDAATVSFSSIKVTAAAVQISYRDGPLCAAATVTTLILPRKGASVVRAA